MTYVIENRLRWVPSSRSTPLTGPLFDFENATPFADARDYKIMPNDWPYGLEKGVRHIIVWLKNKLDTEPTRGDLTPSSRAQIEAFVQQKFVEPTKHLPGSRDRIMWFKNWVRARPTLLSTWLTPQTSLQSVPGIDHVHLLVRDVPEDIINSWTGGEIPMQATVNGISGG